MLGFDYELRRRGFAGNSCQILLQLSKIIEPARLQQRVAELVAKNPVLQSRPVRGLNPRWKPTSTVPQIRVHAETAEILEFLFNEPLDILRGELLRFDLVGRAVIFTWAHALMDAKSAEYFLALVGNPQLPLPEPEQDWYVQRANAAGNLRARLRRAWLSLERLEQFKREPPVSLATVRPPTACKMKYTISAFSGDDSARVHAKSTALCGFLGETNFHLAATLFELHRLHRRVGCTATSYVVPIPISLRPKGTRSPLFSNQLTTMLYQFFPSQLETIEQAVAAIKNQRADVLRGGYIDSSIALGQLFRALPLRLYMWLAKRELRGEICSLFFGDTAAVDPALETFFDADIETFVHVPAVTVPPGVGVVFYTFRHQLHFTLVYAEGTLAENEADEFVRSLRQQLLNP